jgi:hypothetical protein
MPEPNTERRFIVERVGPEGSGVYSLHMRSGVGDDLPLLTPPASLERVEFGYRYDETGKVRAFVLELTMTTPDEDGE